VPVYYHPYFPRQLVEERTRLHRGRHVGLPISYVAGIVAASIDIHAESMTWGTCAQSALLSANLLPFELRLVAFKDLR
jgi:hypothetical protein